MIEYSYIGGPGGLRRETKTGWSRGVLKEDTRFIHGTGVPPSKIKTFGISPLYAGEYLIDPDGKPIGSGKMIFAFKTVALVDAPANAYKRSPAVKRMFGEGHAYVFLAPAGTEYYSTGGLCGPGSEIAFPYIIESTDIEFYIPPNSTENFPWPPNKAVLTLCG
jgi:hypothetical protein